MNERRILLAGPPGVGKSTIIEHLHSVLPVQFEHASLDDDVLALCEATGIHGRLTDSFIDIAVGRLLNRSPSSSVVELPHHDYVQLIERGVLRLEMFNGIVILRAPLPVLKARNAGRRYNVPEDYITRCFGASHALAAYLDGKAPAWIVCDSNILTDWQNAQLIADFMKRNESASLRSLDVFSHPDQSYIGGNLRTAIEWDETLIRTVCEHFHFVTALDVGCGAGLSVDRFKSFGINAWGIDCNTSILSGPAELRERLLVGDFTKQWIEWPNKVDLVWCVEVLEHIPAAFEDNILRTISANTGALAFVSAAQPHQRGFHHVNCQPKEYWISRFRDYGLIYSPALDSLLAPLKDTGPFGCNFLKQNGMFFEPER